MVYSCEGWLFCYGMVTALVAHAVLCTAIGLKSTSRNAIGRKPITEDTTEPNNIRGSRLSLGGDSLDVSLRDVRREFRGVRRFKQNDSINYRRCLQPPGFASAPTASTDGHWTSVWMWDGAGTRGSAKHAMTQRTFRDSFFAFVLWLKTRRSFNTR
jgi:hypothetical protein